MDFLEWDGMVRLVFNRKNKTLRAIFTQKNVLKMLEKNHELILKNGGKRVVSDAMAMQGEEEEQEEEEGGVEEEEEMEIEKGNARMKELVEKVLKDLNMVVSEFELVKERLTIE